MEVSQFTIEEHKIAIDGLNIHVARKIVSGRTTTPLLLFNGIGANIELLFSLIGALEGIECITFDMPGVGQSDIPLFPMRFKRLAKLSTQILDHFNYANVDALGVSWGGALAQEFAKRYSHRCRKLVLVATSPGAIMVPGKPSVFMKLTNPKRYTDSAYLSNIAHHIYGGALREKPEQIQEYAQQIKPPQSSRGYLWQLAAAAGWTSIHWLHKLAQPTMILAGNDDPLVPFINAKIMHSRIPNSQLVEVDCGHLLLLTQQKTVVPLILNFLNSEI